MVLMSPLDAAFLIPETREQPMHVGSLQLYRTPEGAGRNYLTDVYQQLLAVDDIAPLFRKRPHRSWSTLGQWAWQDDRDIDLEHHVRHSALPRPGRIRELLALTSRLHSTLLDRQRPLWEMHLIEGLRDGRFAVYFKVHHALMDGVSGLRLMQNVLSSDPDNAELRAPYMPFEPSRPRQSGGGFNVGAVPGAARGALSEIASLGPALLKVGERLLREQADALPMQAPRTILNGSITGSRRFAAQSWALPRLKSVAAASGSSLNDVVLAMSAGALRRYLQDLSALPDSPLIAMVPVSLRGLGEHSSGNSVGTILCNLATNEPDPTVRLATIRDSMQQGKDSMSSMTRLQITAMSSVALAPIVLGTMFGAYRLLSPPFNVTISNVPGPRRPLYMGAARLEEFYPLSIPTVGQALNITVISYVDEMEFGLTGCRRHVPHLQRLLTHLETSLDELEVAVAA